MKQISLKVRNKNWAKTKKGWLGWLTLSMMLLSFQASAQLFDVAGNCTMLSTTTYGPMYSTTNPSATNRMAVTYPSTQLLSLTGQELTSIYFKRGGATVDPTVGTPNFKVYLKESASIDFGAGALDWATAITGATLVYDSNPLTIMQGGLGWKEFVFSTNFTYSGTNNLVVLMEYVNTGNSTNVQWEYEYSNPCINTTNSTTSKYVNTTNGTLGTSLTSQNYRRPHIAFDYTVTCTAPTNILMTGISSTGVTFDWTAGGTETNWDYAVHPQGTGIPAVFTATTASDATVNSLSPNTNYEFFVRSNCGGINGESAWMGPFNFTTPCAAASIPFFEGFETGYIHNDDVAGCWYQIQPSGTKKWTANNTLTTYNRAPNTGAWDAFLGSSGNSWMFQGINLVAGTNYMVKFNARQDATTVGNAKISAFFGLTPVEASMTDVVVPSTDLTNGNYQEMTGYFNPTTSGVYFLGINGIKVGNWYLTLDDISIVVAPSCAAPTQLAVSNLSGNTADLSWLENGTATDWDVEFGPAGFTPTGTPTHANTTNPTLLTSLTPSTAYEFYVRSICSPSDKSVWEGPFTFSTTQMPATIPFIDDFSTSQWSFENGTEPNQWYIGAAAGNPANGMYISNDNGVTNAYTITTSSATHAYRDVIFPAGLNTFNLSFDWKAGGESSLDRIRVWMVPSTATFTPGTQITTTNTPGAIQLGGNYNQSTTWVFGENVIIPASYAGTNARLVFEWRNDGSVGTQSPAAIDNVQMTVITCPAPTALATSNATTTTMDLTWVENGSSTDWEISYGIGSFNPSAGTIVTATTNPFTVTGLLPSSTYNFYVRSTCSASDSSTWFGPIEGITLCAPITALPWTENFDNLASVGTTSYPPCWFNENPSPAVWSSTSTALSTTTPGPLSPANYLRVRYNSDATMWTPEFDLIAGETYEFTFNWAGSGSSGWEGSVYVNGSQSSTGATMLGTNFSESLDITTFDYQEETYCFVPTTSGAYAFGVRMQSTATSRYLGFDDFELKRVITTPGIDGSLSACQTGSAVDLNTVITAATTDGTWNFALNPSALNSAGVLNVNGIPSGVHNIYFITTGCAPDTTIAKITVVQPSSAGNDGAIAVCRNQPFNLVSGLTGNADLGGVWTDPNGTVVPNGNVNASNIPGQFNFEYIVTNGVCPADTAKVVINVQGNCDYLGLEDVAFEGFKMYPNPTSDVVFISNTGSTEVFNYEVLDMNGRVILKANQAINGSTTTEINLSEVEVGVYMVRVFNENADKTFRVVKN